MVCKNGMYEVLKEGTEMAEQFHLLHSDMVTFLAKLTTHATW